MIHGEERFPALGEPVEPIRSGTAAYGWEGGVTHPSALSEKRNRGRRFSSCVIKRCNRRGDGS